MLKPEIIGHHFLHLLSPPRLSVLFYESESSWHQRDQRIVSHGPHIITKNNSFKIKVSPPRSLLDSLSNYFLLVKFGIMSKHRRLLVHIKGKKILRISALCQHKGIFNNAIPIDVAKDRTHRYFLRRVSVFHVPVHDVEGRVLLGS